jgi:CRISPR-associated protein Csb2
MSFAIIAEFPLGTYRGHRPDGTLDDLPSPARLHAALLNAAAQGPRAEAIGDGQLAPSAVDRAALAWAESNPPDALHVPQLVRNEPKAGTYRKQGLWFNWSEKSDLRDADGSIATQGPIAWIWDDPPPRPVEEALAGICGDVSHLGTGESPVVLRLGQIEPTHRRNLSASPFAGSGLDLEIPRPGRGQALEIAYRRATKSGSRQNTDEVKSNEVLLPPPVERGYVGSGRYVALAEKQELLLFSPPWDVALVLPIDEIVPPAFRVLWAVALHRALVSRIGDGAPALITGKYGVGVRKPANRLAIQYVDRLARPGFDLDRGALVLLLPTGADPRERRLLGDALLQIKQLQVTRDWSARIRADRARAVPAAEFWPPVPVGHRRTWTTEPVAVPESFSVRGRSWTLEDAALLSVALLWRDELGVGPRDRDWYAKLADRARGHGVLVREAHRLQSQQQDRFVHRVQPGLTVQPYRAVISLGEMCGERTVVAIGQSRHLGGGLLVPTDVREQR